MVKTVSHPIDKYGNFTVVGNGLYRNRPRCPHCNSMKTSWVGSLSNMLYKTWECETCKQGDRNRGKVTPGLYIFLTPRESVFRLGGRGMAAQGKKGWVRW